MSPNLPNHFEWTELMAHQEEEGDEPEPPKPFEWTED